MKGRMPPPKFNPGQPRDKSFVKKTVSQDNGVRAVTALGGLAWIILDSSTKVYPIPLWVPAVGRHTRGTHAV